MLRCPHRKTRLAFLIFLGVGGLVVGCEEEFSDEKFGVLDLGPVYDANGGPVGASVPEEINARRGYIEGRVAEYYDFGVVPSIINPADGTPTAVRVQPMYFFFGANQEPLFSRPVREMRDGTDWMRGGQNVLDPNPVDFCAGVAEGDQAACKMRNEAERKKPYALRLRTTLKDANRMGSDDYQRPLVDLTPQDATPPRQEYTGLWEIIEVSAPRDYVPDSIKSVATLMKAVEAKKLSLKATGKVINCPIVDERTYVNRGITSRRIFRPRIQLWYRRLMGECFLANGWETLGLPDGQLFFAGQPAERLDTFEVARLSLPGLPPELVVPVDRAYEPAIVSGADGSVNRVPNNLVTAGEPRRQAGDPGGYTPLRWMIDVPAPADFFPGGWKALSDIDPSKGAPRGGFVNPEVRNLPLRGIALACSFPEDYSTLDDFGRRRKQCGRRVPDTRPGAPPTATVFDSKGDPVCNQERDPSNPNDKPLECNKDTCFCDAPIVGYGQACGPGVAQCSGERDAFSADGYRCFPPWGGFCQRGCRASGPNTRAEENVGKEPNQWVDSRCGGIPGFICYGPLATCIKICDQNIIDPGQCAVTTTIGGEERDIQKGQTCQDFGLQVCTWPEGWSPEEFNTSQ